MWAQESIDVVNTGKLEKPRRERMEVELEGPVREHEAHMLQVSHPFHWNSILGNTDLNQGAH